MARVSNELTQAPPVCFYKLALFKKQTSNKVIRITSKIEKRLGQTQSKTTNDSLTCSLVGGQET